MNITMHPVAPEDVMAFLDGELSSTEAQSVSAHLDQCAECAELAEQFRAMSQSLASWAVPAVSSRLEDSVNATAAKTLANQKNSKATPAIRTTFWNWKPWAAGSAGALAIASILLVIAASISYHSRRVELAREQNQETQSDSLQAAPAPPAIEEKQLATAMASIDTALNPHSEARSGGGGGADQATAPSMPVPLIARTVALSIVVKDFAAARSSLDSILVRHHGYSAQLTVTTPENAPRSFQASLRIPATELASTLAELKTLGHVENETQSGEEVTQQHADLEARLKNSRETEDRLRAILEQRTGKIEDVLQVEEEIARVRGEIESTEAAQKELEHRVDYATVDLQLTEEYKAQLSSPSASVSNRIHNAFVDGLRNASSTLLGIVLFFEEYGPVLLIWLAILVLPTALVVRRYRRIHREL